MTQETYKHKTLDEITSLTGKSMKVRDAQNTKIYPCAECEKIESTLKIIVAPAISARKYVSEEDIDHYITASMDRICSKCDYSKYTGK